LISDVFLLCAGDGSQHFPQFQAGYCGRALEQHANPAFRTLVGMHHRHVLSLKGDLPLGYGIIGKSHDSHKECGLTRSIGTEQHMGLPFIDVEINIAQHFLVADIYMKVFDMQHNSIEECMSIAALNAFQRDISIPSTDNVRITGTGPALVFQTRSGSHIKISDRFPDQNRIAIFPE
jgi:hypothetical protein